MAFLSDYVQQNFKHTLWLIKYENKPDNEHVTGES